MNHKTLTRQEARCLRYFRDCTRDRRTVLVEAARRLAAISRRELETKVLDVERRGLAKRWRPRP